MGGPRGTPQQRFWSHVRTGPGCWEWTGTKSAKGYGRLNIGGGVICLAHRLAYKWLIGPIPDGLVIDHLCRNRACVNPSHMEPVTSVQNVMRGIPGQQKGHCRNGHDASEFYRRKSNGRMVQCRACLREKRKRSRIPTVGD